MWGFLRLRLGDREYLKDYCFSMWEDYVDYMLGEKVLNITMSSPDLKTMNRPSWTLFLSYDYEFRRRFALAFNEKRGTLAELMKHVHTTDVYQLKFLTPLAIQAGEAAAKAAATSAASSSKGWLAEPVNSWPEQRRQRQQPDQQPQWPTKRDADICFGFNKGYCNWGDSCRKAHRCLQCGGNHPVTECKNVPAGGYVWPAQGDAKGSASVAKGPGKGADKGAGKGKNGKKGNQGN